MDTGSQLQYPSLEVMREVCARTKKGRATIYGLIKKGVFPQPIRMGGRTYFDSREVSAWIERQLVAGRAQIRDAARFAEMGKRSVAARKARKEAAMQAAA